MTPDEIAKLIPEEVLLAVTAALATRQGTRAAIAAGLAAWRGVQHDQRKEWGKHSRLILPLKETQNGL